MKDNSLKLDKNNIHSGLEQTLPDLALDSPMCPTEPEILLFGLGNLSRLDFEKIACHMEACEKCFEKLKVQLGFEKNDEFLAHIKPLNEKFLAEIPDVSECLERAIALSGKGSAKYHLEKYKPLFSAPQQEGELGTFGKFRIIAEIGYGGMGMVFDALDTQALRRVAVKTLRPDLVGNLQLKDLFLQEARIASSLDNPGIIRVLEVDEIAHVPYFTMPLLKGESLEGFLENQVLPIPRKVFNHLAIQISAALAYLHSQKIVHRDIKPSNIWLEPAEHGYRVMLLDLGLARPVLDAGKSQIRLGTPEFSAPEQTEGKMVTDRADIYSLGKVFLGMLQNEFTGEISENTNSFKNLFDPLPGLIKRMTSLQPAARPSAEQILKELQTSRIRKEPMLVGLGVVVISLFVFWGFSALNQFLNPLREKTKTSQEPANSGIAKKANIAPGHERILHASKVYPGKAGYKSAIASNEYSFVSQNSSREIAISYQNPAFETNHVALDFDLHDLTLNSEGTLLAVMGIGGDLQIFSLPGAKSVFKSEKKIDFPNKIFWAGVASDTLLLASNFKLELLKPGINKKYDGAWEAFFPNSSPKNNPAKIEKVAPLENSDQVAGVLENTRSFAGNISTNKISFFLNHTTNPQSPICMTWKSGDYFSTVYGKIIYTNSFKDRQDLEFFEMPELAREILWLGNKQYLFLNNKILLPEDLFLLQAGSGKKLLSFDVGRESILKLQKLKNQNEFAVICQSGNILIFKFDQQLLGQASNIK